MLAARFQRPVPIIFGILFATIANHAAAGLAGTYFGGLLSGPWDAVDSRSLVPERCGLGAPSR
jgi:putative Ca2+/H+ antiporter (TMEM165/GDT1 family)